MHGNHKLIKISDIESFEKENITIESKEKEINVIAEKIIELKTRIEKEIIQINEGYEKSMDELTKSYLQKHEQLIKEENDLKEKLQNEVTKTKEQLEYYLSQANNEVKIYEKLSKGIKKIQNEEKKMIKNLSYISKINKTKKNMNKLIQQLIKSIKFIYEEEKNIMKYEEYYINGIYKPTNIEIKDVTFSSMDISWQIDNINFLNLDKNKINYRIEIKRENENFKKVYEGNDTKYSINNLNPCTEYEIRICSIYNKTNGEWIDTKKIQTKIDSVILRESNKEGELLSKINEWIENKKLELIYRGTRDGMLCNNFHEKCDNKGQTITLVKNEKNNIFGGFASVPFKTDENGQSQSAPESFIFTLTNIHNTEPIKFSSKKDNKEIYHKKDYGPCFGCDGDLGFHSNFLDKGGWSFFPQNYSDNLGKGKSIFTGNLNENEKEFKIKEIEVFKVL